MCVDEQARAAAHEARARTAEGLRPAGGAALTRRGHAPGPAAMHPCTTTLPLPLNIYDDDDNGCMDVWLER